MFHGKIKSKLDIYVFITEMIPGRLFVSDMRQVGGFLWVLRFPPPIKLTATI